MKLTESPYKNSYFAAANSYDGFYSLFDKIFNPERFDKIFILNGGPGTGKSSLMRSLIPFGKENGFESDAIFCSSDPNSLDGVILSSGKKRCAVIDGTAPHSTDPKLPGACEEIINLGTGFKTELLEKRRKELSELSKSKSSAYEDAYRTLKTAGRIYSDIQTSIAKFVDYSKAERMCVEMLKDVPRDISRENRPDIFVSAFGKDGLVRLNGSWENKITVGSSYCTEFIFTEAFKRNAKENGKLLYTMKSPLSPFMSEGLCLPGKTVISATDNHDIDTDVILSDIPKNHKAMKEMHDTLLDIAAQHFKDAASYHFEMERIYVSAMDFNSNDNILSSLKNRLVEILGS